MREAWWELDALLQVAEVMCKENDTELKLEKKMNEAKMRRCSVAVDTVSLDHGG